MIKYMENRFYITAGNGNFVFLCENYTDIAGVKIRYRTLVDMKCTAIHCYDRYLQMEITGLV